VLGLLAGFIASKVVNKSGAGFVLDIVLGVVGAVVGGALFATLGMSGVTGFNLYDEPTLKVAEINVVTFKGVVQLSGFVSSKVAAGKAVEVADGVGGVKSVKDDIQIE
jgi:hypothetical protein